MSKTISAILGLALAALTSQAMAQTAADPVAAFVDLHATASPLDLLARWRHGVCPTVLGTDAATAARISKRVRAVAGMAIAPVSQDPCAPNLVIVVSGQAQDQLDEILRTQPQRLGPGSPAQVRRSAVMHDPIQAWYATETQGRSGPPLLDGIDTGNPNVDTRSGRADSGVVEGTAGSRLGAKLESQFADVLVVVDRSKVPTLDGAVIDKIALLSLAQSGRFDQCRPLRSVANAALPGCDPSLAATSVSDADLSYLRALYSGDATLGVASRKAAIAARIKRDQPH